MSLPAKPSRWGSFLQQAVAGVEARLDTILTDGDEGSVAATTQQWAATSQSEVAISCSPSSTAVSRPASPVASGRGQDKLQARLARVVATRSAPPSIYPAATGENASELVRFLDSASPPLVANKAAQTTAQSPPTNISSNLFERSVQLPQPSRDGPATCENVALAELATAQSTKARALELERAAEESSETIRLLRDDLSALQREAEAGNATIAPLENEIQAGQRSSHQHTAVMERRRTSELLEELSALKAECARARATELESEVNDVKASGQKLQREGELKGMESKLERVRIQEENVSSRPSGDAHLGIMRQLETLQSQYATATKNWKGIESSLIARATGLEKERDQALSRESELRKKARNSARRSKEEIQSLQATLNQQQREIDDRKRETEQYLLQLSSAKEQVERAERALSHMHEDHERQQTAVWRHDKLDTIDLSRRQWSEDLPGGYPGLSTPASPLPQAPQRTFNSDFLALHGITKSRHISTLTGLGDSTTSSRRTSTVPLSSRPAQVDEENGFGSRVVSPELLPDSLYAPPIYAEDHDLVSVGHKLASSPHHTYQDMVSVSTSAAGPSVQLVERMSAAIRRLEAEKVTSREELGRVCSQRDEARAEISSLIKDAGAREEAVQKVADLECQVVDLHSRYQTTLEMLGEKSELVEELQADIHDLKQMYRELVERAVE